MFQIIGVASGWGAQIRTCEDGPAALEKNSPYKAWDWINPQVSFREKNIPLSQSLPLIVDVDRQLADKVSQYMELGHFPVVIGGDHSIAVGTWNGVGAYLSQKSDLPLGLIWIDAHMDSHTPQTTPSGAWHGMPLAALLGHGAKELVELKRSKPILDPRYICLIGIRSYEAGEAKLLEKLNVKIYFMPEVKKRGFQTVLQEAIAHVSKNTVGYGVSLDVDVIDPSEAPGAGSPEPGGISGAELLQGLRVLKNDERLKAFELVEYNPHCDIDHKTERLCHKILSTVLKEG